MSVFRWICGVLLAGATVAGAGELTSRREHFVSGGDRINVDVFGPKEVKRAVIVLHGAGGMMFDGGQMKALARELVATGTTAYVVNYFNKTNDWFQLGDKKLIAGFPTWLGVVDDAVAWVGGLNGEGPVGIYGYSLGGFLAIAQAAGDGRVGAVVEQSGGIWDQFGGVEKELPPVLIAHGTADERVFFERNTRRIEALAAKHGTVVELMEFEGGKHRLDDTAQARVDRAAAVFFDRWLGE
jgi:dienelactone hydrolase